MANDIIKRRDALAVIETANSMAERLLEATRKLCMTMNNISAVDAVPVVRCKDCKYAEIASMGHLSVCKHPKGMIDPNPNSYCSYGERRTNDD